MRRKPFNNDDLNSAATTAGGVFGRDLLKAGNGFRDVLMDDEPPRESKVSRRAKISAVDFPTIEPMASSRVKRDPIHTETRSRGRDETARDETFKRERDYLKASPQDGESRVARPSVRGKRDSDTRNHRPAIAQSRGIWFWIKLIALFIALLFVGFVLVKWSKPVVNFFEKPIKQVAVEGEFHYLTNARAMDLIYNQIDGHFLQLDLEKLKQGLEADPWVEHVYLSRRWPDTLVVKISEEKPIARWDQSGFVNQSGELVPVKVLDQIMGLPWLKGDAANAREMMQQYQDLSTLLRSRNLEILGLECDSKKSWRLTIINKENVKNNIEIAVGRDQVMEKMDRFLIAYDTFLNSVWKDVEAIDLRYSNGVSVRWLPDSEMAKKYLKPDVSVTKKKS